MGYQNDDKLHDILTIIWNEIKLAMCEIDQVGWWHVDRHEDDTIWQIWLSCWLVVKLKVCQFD
jgi:hypothetical protein